jgi:hypothetical protein
MSIYLIYPYHNIIYVYSRFAYMMMRRYADAIRTFSNILLYVQRTKQMFQVESCYHLCYYQTYLSPHPFMHKIFFSVLNSRRYETDKESREKFPGFSKNGF